MGQQEVFNFLKKHKNKWYTTKEISDLLNVSIGSVTNNLKKLRITEKRLIKYKIVGNKYYYMLKG